MDFRYSDEQIAMRDMVGSFLSKKYGMEHRRAVLASEAGWSPAAWSAFAEELGLLGALLPEHLGGTAGGPIEAMVLMEEMGRALVTEPFLESVVIGSAVLSYAREPVASSLADALTKGDARIAFAQAEPQSRYNLANVETVAREENGKFLLSGHKSVVIGAPIATHLAVVARTSGGSLDREGISLFLIDVHADGITRRDYRTIDGRLASEVYFERFEASSDTIVGEPGAALPLIEKIVDLAVAAVCAEACGVLRTLLSQTVEYTKERHQFGKPLASFQVLQHRMVDMMLKTENALSMSMQASLHLAADHKDASKAVAAAKIYINEACDFVGKAAVQLHGGMGTTDEVAISHYFKRAMMIRNQFGDSDYYIQRYNSLAD